MSTKLIVKLVTGVVLLIITLFVIGNSVTTVGADEIVVKQNLFDGQLQVWNTPGVHWQNFGKITRYKRSEQYWFSAHSDEGKQTDDSISVRFNDGGHGNVSGSLRYDLPLDPAKMIKLHSTYGSASAISHELVKQVVNKSVYMTGPLMSSRESYAEKRADLINFIADQILHGVYKTERHTTKTKDLITGQEKTVDLVTPKLGAGPNGIEREESSPIEAFGLNTYNITINQVTYDPQVEDQIKQQQQATMAIQQAMVDARKAEQAVLTTGKQGEADAAKAKWAQEVEKAKAVTIAEQKKAVAALDLDTAKLDAESQLTKARADSESKKLAISADNALKMRIDAYVDVQKSWAAAAGAHRLTPDIMLGGNGTTTNPSELMQLWTVKVAHDLGVDLKL
jgi:hypothetical protein